MSRDGLLSGNSLIGPDKRGCSTRPKIRKYSIITDSKDIKMTIITMRLRMRNVKNVMPKNIQDLVNSLTNGMDSFMHFWFMP